LKTVFLITKLFFWWIFLPLLLGVVFVVAPCYTLGYLGWERVWCGFKGGLESYSQIVSGMTEQEQSIGGFDFSPCLRGQLDFRPEQLEAENAAHSKIERHAYCR
jgi:hypothetical protein